VVIEAVRQGRVELLVSLDYLSMEDDWDRTGNLVIAHQRATRPNRAGTISAQLGHRLQESVLGEWLAQFGQQLLATPRTLAALARTPNPAPPRLRQAPAIATTATEGDELWLIPRSFRPSGWFPPQLRL
jgi:hypothetical protein